jgi:hypothetical protein
VTKDLEVLLSWQTHPLFLGLGLPILSGLALNL